MTQTELETIVKRCLDDFYRRRIDKLSGLKLWDTLKKKNPYLFRATGIETAPQIVAALLRAYMSSSDEGIFGDAFFEPIAKAVSGGVVAPSEGVDVAVETATVYKAISVKSGPNIFNASQAKRMNDEFMSLRSRMAKLHKEFDALLGHGYGRKKGDPTAKRIYRIRAGQAFWQEITDDPEFYLKLIRAMQNYPAQHRPEFAREFKKAINRFTKEFSDEFVDEDGNIDWDKLTQLNSGIAAVPRPRKGSAGTESEEEPDAVSDEAMDVDDDIVAGIEDDEMDMVDEESLPEE